MTERERLEQERELESVLEITTGDQKHLPPGPAGLFAVRLMLRQEGIDPDDPTLISWTDPVTGSIHFATRAQ